MDFAYSNAPQRSAEWFKIRRGKITASRLEDWMSKAKKDGSPLKARLDYERELMFERQFDTNFNNYITDAMLDGVDYEEFARRQYETITQAKVETVGCYYNKFFVASPDGTSKRVDSLGEGLVEIKVLRDASFTEVLSTGRPIEKHWKQIQGQLWATRAAWCDYVVVNLTTKKIFITRVMPDKDFFAVLEEVVQEELTAEPFKTDNLHDIVGGLPAMVISEGDSQASKGSELW